MAQEDSERIRRRFDDESYAEAASFFSLTLVEPAPGQVRLDRLVPLLVLNEIFTFEHYGNQLLIGKKTRKCTMRLNGRRRLTHCLGITDVSKEIGLVWLLLINRELLALELNLGLFH